MKISTLVVLAAAAMSFPSAAVSQARADENRAAVRRMFPIVTLFDKKKAPVADQAATQSDPAPISAQAAPALTGDAATVMQSLASAPGDRRDIAGIRLGMTPDQVAKAASAAGYARTETKTQDSWATNVRKEEENRSFPKAFPASPTPVLGVETYAGSGSQKLVVDYTATPRGTYVYSVRYSVNMSETPWETMKTRVRAKYGRETYATASELVFCSPGETKCSVFGLYTLPTVDLDHMVGSSWLTMSQGSRYRNAYASAVNAEVDRLHPKNERPAF